MFNVEIALSFTQREELFGHGLYDIDMPDAPDYYAADGWKDADSDEEDAFQTLPPGEEGLHHSHAGKEAIFHQIFDKCKPGRGDSRRCALRVQTMVDVWKEQMPLLVDAYLEFKKNGPINSDNTPGAWTIQVISFEEKGLRSFIHADDTLRTNETLLRHGYIGASPEKVSLAFPIRLFEIFRQIHRVCPRYSFDALSKTLTNLHHGSRQPGLAEHLSTGYDAYLEVVRRVDARMDTALGRDAEWYIKNICPPCLYKTVGEAPLKYSFLACMDGNNSLKLVNSTFRPGTVRPDNRASTSFRWLTPEQVDLYKHEVADSQKKARGQKKKTGSGIPAGPSMPFPPPPEEGTSSLSGNEAEELAKCINTCVERWKAAGPEARKKMFALFAIAGIFVSVCRHGHVLVMCDMIRSGELYVCSSFSAMTTDFNQSE
ncbi:hypothetical protein DFH09DRAFT_917277 [Mycena vulgaris]|nr:hypothetical protein DFH09DRAFT_917277 [Mycena vulgaris]